METKESKSNEKAKKTKCPLGFYSASAYDAGIVELMSKALDYLELFGYEFRDEVRYRLYDKVSESKVIDAMNLPTFAAASIRVAYQIWQKSQVDE